MEMETGPLAAVVLRDERGNGDLVPALEQRSALAAADALDRSDGRHAGDPNPQPVCAGGEGTSECWSVSPAGVSLSLGSAGSVSSSSSPSEPVFCLFSSSM